MTKKQEIEILRETISRLGPDSYCGPWLKGQLGAIESALESDYPPEAYALSPQDALQYCINKRAEAKRDADEIISGAQDYSEKTRKEANLWRDQIRAMVRRDLEAILNKI